MNKILTKGEYDVDTASFAGYHFHWFCDKFVLVSTVQRHPSPLSHQYFISRRRRCHDRCGISRFSWPSWGGLPLSLQLPVNGQLNKEIWMRLRRSELRCPGMKASRCLALSSNCVGLILCNTAAATVSWLARVIDSDIWYSHTLS